MRPELAEACIRIAVKSGDWLTLANCTSHCKVKRDEWRNCLLFWLGHRIQALKLILLALMTIGALPWVWALELPQQNQIEKLRPLVAQLDASGSAGTVVEKVPKGQAKTILEPQITPFSEPKADTKSTNQEPIPANDEKPTVREQTKLLKTPVKPFKTKHPEFTTSSKETSENKTGGNTSSVEPNASLTNNGQFLGFNRNGSGWGSQQTVLHERAPMHFREIDNHESSVWVSETEVTQRQWVALMGLDLSVISGHWDQAVDGVSWCKSLEYANELSKHEKRKPVYRFKGNCEVGGQVSLNHKADGYRLLIESEWLMLAKHAPKEHLISNTNNRGISSVYVDQKPQQNGLYGLQGNAAEWVWAAGTMTHRASRSAAVVRHCSGENNCRQSLKPADRPLGIGLRLARGPIIPKSSDI